MTVVAYPARREQLPSRQLDGIASAHIEELSVALPGLRRGDGLAGWRIEGLSADDADRTQIQFGLICAHLRHLRMGPFPCYGLRRVRSANRGPELTAARPLPPAGGRGPCVGRAPVRDCGRELA